MHDDRLEVTWRGFYGEPTRLRPRAYAVGDLVRGSEWQLGVLLVDLLESSIASYSWGTAGRECSLTLVDEGLLVVDAFPEVHGQVERFLAELRWWLLPSATGYDNGSPYAGNPSLDRTLQQIVVLEFANASLTDAIRWIGDTYQIDIQIDQTLSQSPYFWNRITQRITDVSLETALRQMLRSVDMDFAHRNNSILITSAWKHDNEPILRFHKVGHLIDPDLGCLTCEELLARLRRTAPDGTWFGEGGFGHIQVLHDVLVVVQNRENQRVIKTSLDELTRSAVQKKES